MKNKVLKLCKRLNKVTASEIAPILMITEIEASTIMNINVSVLSCKYLIPSVRLYYFYISC